MLYNGVIVALNGPAAF